MIKSFRKYLAIGTMLSPLALTANASDFWALGEGSFADLTADSSKILISTKVSKSLPEGDTVFSSAYTLYDITNPEKRKLIKSYNNLEEEGGISRPYMSPNGEYIYARRIGSSDNSIELYNFLDGSSFILQQNDFGRPAYDPFPVYFEPIAISNNGIAVDGEYAVNLNNKSIIRLKLPDDAQYANENPTSNRYSFIRSNVAEISDDGSTAVGLVDYNDKGEFAAKWDATTGDYTYLTVADGFTDSLATAVNADGSVIAGVALNDDQYGNISNSQLILWKNGTTEATVIHNEEKSGLKYIPASITAAGDLLVGSVRGNGSSTGGSIVRNGAFIWTEKSGVVYMSRYLSSKGISLSQDTYLTYAHSVSDDGTLISGSGDIEGINQAWLARISPNTSTTDTGDNTNTGGDTNTGSDTGGNANTGGSTNTGSDAGLITSSNTQKSLFSMGMSAYYMLPTLLADNMRLNGQNCDGGKGQFCAFATAAVQKWDESNTDGGLSRIGIGYNLKDNFAIGGLIGYHQMDSDNDYSRFKTDGLTLGLWTSYNQEKAGLQAAANISYSFGDMDTDRFYYNGSKRETAKGSTSYDALSLSASLGYGFKIRQNALLTPFIDLSYIKANIDGFDEEIALFQAAYKDLDSRLWQNHLGVKGRYQLNNKLALLGGLAWGHSMVQDTKVSGSLKEAVGFGSAEHITVKHEDSDWVNISAGIDYKISNQMSIQFSTEGNIGDEHMIAPDFNGQIKFQINF